MTAAQVATVVVAAAVVFVVALLALVAAGRYLEAADARAEEERSQQAVRVMSESMALRLGRPRDQLPVALFQARSEIIAIRRSIAELTDAWLWADEDKRPAVQARIVEEERRLDAVKSRLAL